jgi:hypothetical protein
MEHNALSDAKRKLLVAEKILTETYPVVKEPKLILAVAEDIYSALISAIIVLLKSGNVRFKEDFDSMFDALKDISDSFGFTKEDLDLVKELHNMIVEHRESPVEFSRNDCFVICDANYKCDAISCENMQKYLFRAKLLIKKADSAVVGKESKAKNE